MADMYDQLLSSRLQALQSKRQNTQNQYKNLYDELANREFTGKQRFYNDRNSVDTAVNQNLSRMREMMAKNGWTGGGENMQAQLQSNSDRINGLSSVKENENNYMQDLMNQRNKLNTEEQGIYNDINAEESQTRADVAAQRQQYMDQLYKASAKAPSGSNKDITNAAWQRFYTEFNDGTAEQWLTENPDMINWIGSSEYNKMYDMATKDKVPQSLTRRLNSYYIGGGSGRQLVTP